MSFRITGLPPESFHHLFGLSDTDLARYRALRLVADETSDFADRIELRKPAPGETVLLVNFTHQPADSPYRASHAVHVAEASTRRFEAVDVIPDILLFSVIALRGFDDAGMLKERTIVDGTDVRLGIETVFANPAVAYIHAHYAGAGCYAARIDRE